MDSVDLQVLKAMLEWVTGRHAVWLATVVQTFGSSPRPPGAMLALRADGVAVGSVSGGCIEDEFTERARAGQLPTGHAEIVTFGVTTEEARHYGLPCGGVLKLVLEPVRDGAWIDQLLACIDRHQLVTRTLDLASCTVQIAPTMRDAALEFDGSRLVTVHGPRWRLLIIGAGQTSSYLAHMAMALDYEVVVCDPREEFRQTWNVPGTVLLADMPDDAVVALGLDPCSAVIALTHDPKLDDMALLEALKSPAFYVGALGSKANNAKRRLRLALFDLTEEQIAQLHGPVGLEIGSRTPPEIAVAILAHLISVRNKKTFGGRIITT